MILPPPSSKYKTYSFISRYDLIWIILSPFISLWLRDFGYLNYNQIVYPLTPGAIYIILSTLVFILIFSLFRIDRGLTHLFSARDALNICNATFVSTITTISVIFLYTRLEGLPRSIPLIHGLVVSFGLLFYRLVVRDIYGRIPTLGYGIRTDSFIIVRRIIIIGLDQFSVSAINLTRKQKPQTTQVVAAFSLRGKYEGRSVSNIRIIGSVAELSRIIDEYKIHGVFIDEIWVSDSSVHYSSAIQVYTEEIGKLKNIPVKKISEALNLIIKKRPTDQEHTEFNDEIKNTGYSYLKRALDIIVSLVVIIVFSPIFLMAIITTFFEIGRPIFFWQERVGRYGIPFRIYKIRTLRHPINEDGKLLSEEQRLTKFGKLIRRSRIDEFPQLINIIFGEMSGIGPRPLLPRDQPSDSRIRLLVKPGITGWAQVNGGELLDPEEKNTLDCWYVHNMSLSLDIRIVIKTISVILTGVKR